MPRRNAHVDPLCGPARSPTRRAGATWCSSSEEGSGLPPHRSRPDSTFVSVAGHVAIDPARRSIELTATRSSSVVTPGFGSCISRTRPPGQPIVVALVSSAAYVPTPGDSLFSVSGELGAAGVSSSLDTFFFVSPTSAVDESQRSSGTTRTQDLNPRRGRADGGGATGGCAATSCTRRRTQSRGRRGSHRPGAPCRQPLA